MTSLWLPMVLRGERFQGRWLFDGDRMLDYELLSSLRLRVTSIYSGVD